MYVIHYVGIFSYTCDKWFEKWKATSSLWYLSLPEHTMLKIDFYHLPVSSMCCPLFKCLFQHKDGKLLFLICIYEDLLTRFALRSADPQQFCQDFSSEDSWPGAAFKRNTNKKTGVKHDYHLWQHFTIKKTSYCKILYLFIAIFTSRSLTGELKAECIAVTSLNSLCTVTTSLIY